MTQYLKVNYVVVILVLALSVTAQAETPVVNWISQWGTTSYDVGKGVSLDSSGNVYVTGHTMGNLDGNTNAGSYDMFLTKYNSSGTKLWTQQLGTSSSENSFGVSVDSSGNAYVTGHTAGSLDGNTNAGNDDMFLTKYSTSGTKLWTQQLGTNYGDRGMGVSVDSSGNAYVTGYTLGGLDGNTNAGGGDMFLTKYSTTGTKAWTQQLGSSSSDSGNGVSVDGSGNVYVTGYTYGNLDGNNQGGQDMFLTKYDTTYGTLQWTKQLGSSSDDMGQGMSVDSSGNVYVTGYTRGGLDGNNAGENDMFLTKYDSDGDEVWTKQLGTTDDDRGWGVSVDGSGNAYVTGRTDGNLDGNTNAGDNDIFLTKYDTSGTKLWTKQLGTSNDDRGYGVSVDADGSAYLTGNTYGDLDGSNPGNNESDIFLLKIVTPHPGDANLDGMVNDADLAILGANYNQGSDFEWTDADFTGDGLVDVCDLGILASNWGYGTSVPEPASMAMFTGALATLLFRKRKRA